MFWQFAGGFDHRCLTRPYPEQGYRSCLGIIRLERHYERARVEAAAKRVLKFNTCSYRSMKSILSSGLDRQHDSNGRKILSVIYAVLKIGRPYTSAGGASHTDPCSVLTSL